MFCPVAIFFVAGPTASEPQRKCLACLSLSSEGRGFVGFQKPVFLGKTSEHPKKILFKKSLKIRKSKQKSKAK